MDYRIPPTRIPGRSGRSVVAIAFTVAIALGLGLAALMTGDSANPRVLVVDRPAEPSDRASVATLLPEIRCHGVARNRCTEIAAAAVEAIADPTLPPATSVEIWASMMCGSTFDCPPHRLAGHQPAGSAVVTIGRATVLWVNVTEVVREPDRGSPLARLDAWIIRAGPGS